MIQNNKAFYLRNLELALLLSVKGMKELYGIRMHNTQNPDQSLIYKTLFELEKKELISMDEGNILIYPELDRILEDIKSAEKMLLYINRFSEYPDQCIYLGTAAIFVSIHGTSGDMNRIESISLNLLPEKICEYGFYLAEMVNDESLFEKEEIENPELREQAEALFYKEVSKLEDEEWRKVTDSLKLLSLKNRKCIRQYLLFKDKFNDYLSATDEHVTHLYAYSREKVVDVLRKDLVENDLAI